MSIDWKRYRDECIPPVAEDEPALARIHAQLRWLDEHPIPEGDNYPGRPWAEVKAEFRQSLLDEIERYRWESAGFRFTSEIRDACRDAKED